MLLKEFVANLKSIIKQQHELQMLSRGEMIKSWVSFPSPWQNTQDKPIYREFHKF
jgi:hypothetical protein